MGPVGEVLIVLAEGCEVAKSVIPAGPFFEDILVAEGTIMERDEIRSFIVAEVASQLTPLKTTLARLEIGLEKAASFMLKLWSNGSGGPPGYLEIAREEDLQRERKRDSQVVTILEEVRELREGRIRDDGAEAGIEENEERDRRRGKFGIDRVMMILGILTLLAILATLVWDIKTHSGKSSILDIFHSENPSFALSSSRPQDASIPPLE